MRYTASIWLGFLIVEDKFANDWNPKTFLTQETQVGWFHRLLGSSVDGISPAAQKDVGPSEISDDNEKEDAFRAMDNNAD